MEGIIEVKGAALVETNSIFTAEMVSRWIKFAGVSEKSEATYRMAIRQMFRYFTDNSISRPAREDLENWRDELIAAKKSASTVQLYLTSAKLFFRWLAQEGLYGNIADHIKSRVKISHEHKKDALSAEQSANLIKAISGNSEKSLRDRAILALMLTAGLRTIEIERANADDFSYFNGDCFMRVQGKGHSAKDQLVRVDSRVKAMIDEYLKTRSNVVADDVGTPLFTSTARLNKGARLSTQTVRKMVKANLRAIGLDDKRLSAHSLRHSAALQMLLGGASLEQVQQSLRHVSLNTTMIYHHAIERAKNPAEIFAANAVFTALDAITAAA